MSRQNDDFLQFVLDQLSSLRGLRSRRMFGAHGIYQGDLFFAIVDDGTLYFRTGEVNVGDFTERGMKPFEYAPGAVLKNYYQVPADVLEDDRLMCRWAEKAVRAQAEHKASSRPKSPRKKTR